MWMVRNRKFGDLFWGPWSDFRRVRSELDRLLDGVHAAYPPVNVWTGDKGAVVRAELPGLDARDVELSVEGRNLTLRGERTATDQVDGETTRRCERFSGSFSRSIELPFEADSQNVEASYRRGILEVRVPRTPADLPRKIQVRVV